MLYGHYKGVLRSLRCPPVFRHTARPGLKKKLTSVRPGLIINFTLLLCIACTQLMSYSPLNCRITKPNTYQIVAEIEYEQVLGLVESGRHLSELVTAQIHHRQVFQTE